MKRIISICLILICTWFLKSSICYADSALVLPKGVTRIDVEFDFYIPIKERFNSDGDAVPLGDSLNIPLGLILGNMDIPGRTDVTFELEHQEYEILLSYGVTDKFSIGFLFPYYRTKNEVNAAVVDNPFVTIDDLQNLLQAYGYEPLENWSNNGISDIEMGGRYQYYKSDNWRLAFTGAVRFPTGDGENIDSLNHFPHGDDAFSILLHSNNDYTGFKNILLNATIRYEIGLPYDDTFRVPAPGEFLTANKEELERDPGDVFEIELQGTYRFDNGFGLSAVYEYGQKFEDSFSGGTRNSYSVLEEHTDVKSHIFIAYVSYSTIEKYVAKEFSMPLDVSIGYRNRFAGENTLKSEYFALWTTLYF